MTFYKRHLIGSILLGLLFICGVHARLWAQTSPPYPLELPQDGAWVIYAHSQKADNAISERRSVFIVKGKQWRLETERQGGQAIVAVYDGKKLFLAAQTKLRPEDLDRRDFYQRVYRTIPKQLLYNGTEAVNGYDCWRFAGAEGVEVNVKVWVDKANAMVRKAFFRSWDNEVITEEFFDLPDAIVRPGGLFDPQNLSPLLISQIKEWRLKRE